MSDTDKNNHLRRWFTDGIVIATATLMGYLVAYRYESGFLAFYGIPDDFIEITLMSVLAAGFTVFSFILLILVLFQSLSILLPKDFGVLAQPLMRLSFFFIGFIVELFAYGLEWRKWILMLGLLVGFSVLEFIFPLLSQREVKGYRQKLEAAYSHDANYMRTRFISNLHGRIDQTMLFVVIFFLFVITFAYSLGESKARRQVDYLVIDTSPEAAVLRTYGDKLICMPFDRKNKEVQKKFFILKISDDIKNVVFRFDHVGPLHLRNDSS